MRITSRRARSWWTTTRAVFEKAGLDRQSQGTAAGRISAAAAGTDSFHLSASRGEPAADGGADEIRRHGHRLRNHRSEPPAAVARTDERNRRAHVACWWAVIFWRNISAAAACCWAACRACCRAKWWCWAAARRASTPRAWRTGLGADVTILEVDLERMRFLDITLHTAHTLFSSEAHLMEFAADGGFADRRGAGAGRESAETHQPRNAAPDAARQRAGGHRD